MQNDEGQRFLKLRACRQLVSFIISVSSFYFIMKIKLHWPASLHGILARSRYNTGPEGRGSLPALGLGCLSPFPPTHVL